MKRLIVIGSGAVGGSIGAALTRANHPVLFVARGDHGQAIREKGLQFRCPDETDQVLAVPCVERIQDVCWRDGDVALLATKLYSLQSAAEQLLAVAGPGVPVVCATNGLQGERWAMERFDNVLSMLVWVAATHLSPGEVKLFSTRDCRGVLDNGPVQGDSDSLSTQLCKWLADAGFDAVSRHDMPRWKTTKLLTNLGATAQALVTGEWKPIARLAAEEGRHVLNAAAVDHVAEQEFERRVGHVELVPINGHARQGGSTWQSFQRKRPLETPWLEGEIVRIARASSIQAPVNEALTHVAKRSHQITPREFYTDAQIDPDTIDLC